MNMTWTQQIQRNACVASLLLVACVAQAQSVYRIVGPDGKVTFSDKPPVNPATVSVTGRGGKPVPVRAEETVLPFDLRQAMARYPVTLYSGPGCVPCNAGRLLLQGRGVPYTEFNVSSNADIDALQRISGDNSLPFLTIGGQKIKGYSQTEWLQSRSSATSCASSASQACSRAAGCTSSQRGQPDRHQVLIKPPTGCGRQLQGDQKDMVRTPSRVPSRQMSAFWCANTPTVTTPGH